jgi:hypothetical protein
VNQAVSGLIAVVIMLIPVMFFMPAMLMLIPPPMMLAPAPFPRLVQFVTLVIGLGTVPSVALNGFVEFMVGVLNTPLAPLHTLRMGQRHSGE